uniref:CCHC-type domain-containing protein n=1 Tax=Oreochromis niloticus TaxID=8128 RepID=A0A669BFT6_ORENI
MTPLSGREPKAVTVIMHSEYVRVEDIKTWLSFKCSVLRGLDLKDEDGIRTGAYRFYVHLKRDENSGELMHLPPIIQLGAIRGYVFYPGQPKTCRKCGSNDHLTMECVNVVCRNCKSGEHIIKDCPYPKNCNLCGKEDHTFRSCPQSYANRLRMPQVQQAEETPVVTGNSAPTNADRGYNQSNEPQLEAVGNQTGADQDGEPAGSSSCQAGNVKESNRIETIQEEMEVFLRTPDLTLSSTSKECTDLLDLMFPDLPMEGTKHAVELDEDFLLLPVHASKDKPPPFPLSPFPFPQNFYYSLGLMMCQVHSNDK